MAKEKFIINLFKGNFIFELKKNIISKIIQESIYLFKLNEDNRLKLKKKIDMKSLSYHLKKCEKCNPPLKYRGQSIYVLYKVKILALYQLTSM